VSNVTPPPGWYPDPWKQAAQRFWDGTQWTHRIAGGGAPYPTERPRVADDAPIYGPFIWAIALLPLLSAVLIWFIRIDFSSYLESIRRLEEYQSNGGVGPTPMIDPFSMFGPGYWVAELVGVLLYAAVTVLAVFDRRRLLSIGVVRPFHWAWAFLGIVYPIGRSVIVHRVAKPRGLAPLWVTIGVVVATIISSSIWAAVFTSRLVDELSRLANTFPPS
jgi:hypothetical protein